MRFTLHAIIDQDHRKLEYQSLWDAHLAAYTLLHKKLGWPVKITFQGICVSDESNLHEFDERFESLIDFSDLSDTALVRLGRLKKDILQEARKRVIPDYCAEAE